MTTREKKHQLYCCNLLWLFYIDTNIINNLENNNLDASLHIEITQESHWW